MSQAGPAIKQILLFPFTRYYIQRYFIGRHGYTYIELNK